MNKGVTARTVQFHQILISQLFTTAKMDQPTGKWNPDQDNLPNLFFYLKINCGSILKIIDIIM